MERFCVARFAAGVAESVTRIWKLETPAGAVGVPIIEHPTSCRPPGSVPELSVQEYGEIPPDAVI